MPYYNSNDEIHISKSSSEATLWFFEIGDICEKFTLPHIFYHILTIINYIMKYISHLSIVRQSWSYLNYIIIQQYCSFWIILGHISLPWTIFGNIGNCVSISKCPEENHSPYSCYKPGQYQVYHSQYWTIFCTILVYIG